jgi:excisionase family DNA binding protein
LTFIDESATSALTGLLAQTHPGGLDDGAVDIETMAELLSVSAPTVRRMTKANQIPYLRFGRVLRFVPNDVFASLTYNGR